MTAVAPAFMAQSRRLLSEPYLPRIERCLERFSEDEIWGRANPACNSVGNLMLHLASNVRQWVISGLGLAVDRRQRPQEVDARGPIARAALLNGLQRTVAEADVVLASISPPRLPERRQIQGCDVTVLEAIDPVVEPFSRHTGRSLLLPKMWYGDVAFSEVSDGTPRPRWHRQASVGSQE
jgi:hypothetical protein